MTEYLRKMGFKNPYTELSAGIATWRSWYRGDVSKFHEYRTYNGKKWVKCHRATLGMAKHICEDFANLLLNEKVAVSAGTEELTNIISDVFEKNGFRVRANRLCELAFAVGTGAFVEYRDEAGAVKIDYIEAESIYPLSWDRGSVSECAFCSEKVIRGKKYAYIQAHILDERGNYVVKNRLFDTESGIEAPLPPGVEPDFKTNSPLPLFQLITPNIVNTVDTGSPMGISVFGCALDALSCVDLVFDDFCTEFRLGKRRILVPLNMAQIMDDGGGVMKPVFDEDDTEFYGLPDDAVEKVEPMDVPIRASELTEGLNKALDLLSMRCGLGAGRYRFESGGVKTATEVISDKSSTYQNLEKHMQVIRTAVVGLVRAILFLSGKAPDAEINVDFDDSIIHDTVTEFTQNLQLVSSGIMTKYEFREWWFNESEEEARKVLAEIENEEADVPGVGVGF